MFITSTGWHSVSGSKWTNKDACTNIHRCAKLFGFCFSQVCRQRVTSVLNQTAPKIPSSKPVSDFFWQFLSDLVKGPASSWLTFLCSFMPRTSIFPPTWGGGGSEIEVDCPEIKGLADPPVNMPKCPWAKRCRTKLLPIVRSARGMIVCCHWCVSVV